LNGAVIAPRGQFSDITQYDGDSKSKLQAFSAVNGKNYLIFTIRHPTGSGKRLFQGTL
jgi:hypothetical protein